MFLEKARNYGIICISHIQLYAKYLNREVLKYENYFSNGGL
jgi:hypothetical protein